MSSAPSNRAAWLAGPKEQLKVGSAEFPKVAPGQVIIRNRALAVNPVDWKVVDYGLFYKSWPNVLGTDVAGEIYEVGEGVRGELKKGARVIAHADNLFNSVPSRGAYQEYTLADARVTTTIPDSLSFKEAVVLPLAFDTAFIGLSKALGLPQPSLSPKPANKTVVLWGGSSSVGALVTQIAAASGVKVVAVASERNFDFVKRNGASAVLDYHSSSIVDEVVKAVKDVGGEFAGVYDAISLPESYEHVVPIAEKLGGGSVAAVLYDHPKNLPANVKFVQVSGIDAEFTANVWEKFIPKALESGSLRAVPEPLVVGKGLEALQEGLNVQRKGVSAKKVVIEL